MNDVAAVKIASLQRCVARARQSLAAAGAQFASDYDRQDAAILNVIRSCDTAIDLANMAVRSRKLGVPVESRESFSILERESLIDANLSQRLRAMVGFRNLAVHQYRELDIAIVEQVIRVRLDDLLAFSSQIGSFIS